RSSTFSVRDRGGQMTHSPPPSSGLDESITRPGCASSGDASIVTSADTPAEATSRATSRAVCTGSLPGNAATAAPSMTMTGRPSVERVHVDDRVDDADARGNILRANLQPIGAVRDELFVGHPDQSGRDPPDRFGRICG